MNETIISVEGRFDHHHPAERGTVMLTAGFDGAERESVVRWTTEVHGRLSDEARQLTDPSVAAATWWSSDRLRVWSARPWSKEGEPPLAVVHHAAVQLEVKFRDLGRLAAWVEEVAARKGVSVGGIDWALTEVTRARLTADAQARAIQDAVARATVYAHGLGLTAVRPVAVADPGMLGDSSRPTSGPSAAPSARSASSAAPKGGLDLKPEDITVGASVHARFAAS